MNVTNAIRLYLRIYQNNYLHLNRVKLNKNTHDWHYIGDYEQQFYLVNDILSNYDDCDKLMLSYFVSLNMDDEESNFFWNFFTALDQVFYICGRMIDGKLTTIDNRAKLLVRLAKTPNPSDNRLILIKKLLANSFIPRESTQYIDFVDKNIIFKTSNESIIIKEFIKDWYIPESADPNAQKVLEILKDYYLSLIYFLEMGVKDKFFDNYIFPKTIKPHGKRIKIQYDDIENMYPGKVW